MDFLLALVIEANPVPYVFNSCLAYAEAIDRLYENPYLALPMNEGTRAEIHQMLKQSVNPKCIPLEV